MEEVNVLQQEKKESADKLEVFVMCPGLSKDEVTISFDKKEGVLEVMGIPKENAVSEILDLAISGKIDISPKYRSKEIEAVVENGIATIVFGLAEDVNLIDVK